MGIKNKPQKGLEDPRHPKMGWRYYGNEDLSEKNIDWEKIRIENLIPEFGKELSSDSYILEYGFENLNGVDFKKGCYVGQEVTARMKHKSKLRKGLALVGTTGSVPFDTPINANNKIVGKVFSSTKNQALAYLRFEFASQKMMAGEIEVTYQKIILRINQARSEYSSVSVLTLIFSSWSIKGGTMTFIPLSNIAGLKLFAAV